MYTGSVHKQKFTFISCVGGGEGGVPISSAQKIKEIVWVWETKEGNFCNLLLSSYITCSNRYSLHELGFHRQMCEPAIEMVKTLGSH